MCLVIVLASTWRRLELVAMMISECLWCVSWSSVVFVLMKMIVWGQ